MKKHNYLSKAMILLLLIFVPTLLLAQNTVTGKVVDQETGRPIPLANILEKNTTNGVTSDFDGNFSIQVKSLPTTLIFSVLGFTTKEIPI